MKKTTAKAISPSLGEIGTQLSDRVFEEALQRFGFSGVPDPTYETLAKLYKAWCREIGYDNVQKRIYYGRGQTGPFPVMHPDDFLTSWMTHGTSGSCWPSAEALFGLLKKTGYEVERVSCEMLECNDPMRPNHGTCFVHLDAEIYVIDTGMVAELPLALRKGEETSTPSKAFGIWSKGDGRIWWRPGHSRQAVEVDVLDRNCTYDFFEYRYEKTKEFSLFNNSLYVRRNVDDGILTYGRGSLVTVTPEGEMSAAPVDEKDLPGLLIDRLGLSEEIVSQVPLRDEDGAVFDR